MKSNKKMKQDYNLFLDIQTGKYLKNANKTEFSNDAEAQLVIKKIVDVYNQKVASNHLRLDNLNKDAKIAWFNSIEINFDEEIDNANEFMDDIDPADMDLDTISEHFDYIYYFLPRGAWKVLILAGPAFEAINFRLKRFKEISAGAPLTKIEIDVFTWAYELTLVVIETVIEKSKKKRREAMEEAVAIGLEFLNKEETEKVIIEISNLFINISKGNIPDELKKK